MKRRQVLRRKIQRRKWPKLTTVLTVRSGQAYRPCIYRLLIYRRFFFRLLTYRRFIYHRFTYRLLNTPVDRLPGTTRWSPRPLVLSWMEGPLLRLKERR